MSCVSEITSRLRPTHALSAGVASVRDQTSAASLPVGVHVVELDSTVSVCDTPSLSSTLIQAVSVRTTSVSQAAPFTAWTSNVACATPTNDAASATSTLISTLVNGATRLIQTVLPFGNVMPGVGVVIVTVLS